VTDGAIALTRRTVDAGGYRLSYLEAGPPDGPVVLLLHGLVSDGTTWQPAMESLAALKLRVIALDLLGHGESDQPRIAYSLEDFAASISAFLAALEIPDATVVGHSLGGAIAMVFAHDYADQAARLVLVASGGLGKQVHLVLRGATLPGAQTVLRLVVNRRTAPVYTRPALHRALRLRPEAVSNLARIGRSLLTEAGRSTFIAAATSVIGPRGQLGSMIELDYLAADRPTLIIWSERDPIIPVEHAHATHAHLPRSQLELLPGSSHEPHRRHAVRVAETVAQLVRRS
jgi:pimeloyl-ACP methyl ester carboxylesterase